MIVGFRMVGVKGHEVASAAEADAVLSKALEDDDVAIIMISEEFSSSLKERIEKYRFSHIMPLIVEIPGKLGATAKLHLSELIGKSLGIRL